MFLQTAAATFSVLVLVAGDDTPKEQQKAEESKPSVCVGLSEADCKAKNVCFWEMPDSECEKMPTKQTRCERAQFNWDE